MRNLLLMGGAVMAGLMLYAVVVHQICTWRANTHSDFHIKWVESRGALLGVTGFWGAWSAFAAGYDTNYGLSMSLPTLSYRRRWRHGTLLGWGTRETRRVRRRL